MGNTRELFDGYTPEDQKRALGNFFMFAGGGDYILSSNIEKTDDVINAIGAEKMLEILAKNASGGGYIHARHLVMKAIADDRFDEMVKLLESGDPPSLSLKMDIWQQIAERHGNPQ